MSDKVCLVDRNVYERFHYHFPKVNLFDLHQNIGECLASDASIICVVTKSLNSFVFVCFNFYQYSYMRLC